MAKYGLGQIDLNLLVQLSLEGLIDSPEDHLSRLLRSQQPIEAGTRNALANALDGRLNSSKLHVHQTKQNGFVRKLRSERHQIEIGHRVSAMMTEESMTYDKAIEVVADACGRSEKWVQACQTKANKLQRWIKECRDIGLNHSDAALEMAFNYSTLKGMDPGEGLKPTIERLAKIILMFEASVVDAAGYRRPA